MFDVSLNLAIVSLLGLEDITVTPATLGRLPKCPASSYL